MENRMRIIGIEYRQPLPVSIEDLLRIYIYDKSAFEHFVRKYRKDTLPVSEFVVDGYYVLQVAAAGYLRSSTRVYIEPRFRCLNIEILYSARENNSFMSDEEVEKERESKKIFCDFDSVEKFSNLKEKVEKDGQTLEEYSKKVGSNNYYQLCLIKNKFAHRDFVISRYIPEEYDLDTLKCVFNNGIFEICIAPTEQEDLDKLRKQSYVEIPIMEK